LVLSQPAAIALIAILAGKLTRSAVIPWESTVSALDVQDLPRWLRAYPILERVFYRNVPTVAAVSEDVAHALRSQLSSVGKHPNVVVIPNPVHATEIRELAGKVPSVGRPSTIICAVGRLASQKGFDILIEAMALAEPQMSGEWVLRVVGDGPLRGSLMRLARVKGLDSRVEFIGEVENPYPIMLNATVFVQPSRWEGFSVALVEALSLGVPCVAADSPGAAREVLRDGKVGVLVPPDDPVSLADALVELTRNERLRARLSHLGPRRVEEFAPRRVAERIQALLLDPRNGPVQQKSEEANPW